MCICLLAACGKQTDDGSADTTAQSVTEDENGFESVSGDESATVGSSSDTSDTGNGSASSGTEDNKSETTATGGNSGGIVELPTVPI